jgi:hypothetical protein
MNLGPTELLIVLVVLAVPALFGVFVVVAVSVLRQRTRDELDPSATTAGVSVADEVAKLVALRDAGAITEDEFVAQKVKLLG